MSGWQLARFEEITMHFDAGCRGGNPGECGIGVYATMKNALYQYTELVGIKTNNEAEWLACIKALELARDHGEALKKLNIFSDSKLVVMQATGQWRTRAHLIELRDRAYEIVDELSGRGVHVTIEHVKRELNKDADRIVTELLDSHTLNKRGY